MPRSSALRLKTASVLPEEFNLKGEVHKGVVRFLPAGRLPSIWMIECRDSVRVSFVHRLRCVDADAGTLAFQRVILWAADVTSAGNNCTALVFRSSQVGCDPVRSDLMRIVRIGRDDSHFRVS